MRDLDICHHECERLLLSELARAQGVDCSLVSRVAREMVAANTLHRQYLPFAQQRSRRRYHRIVAMQLRVPVQQPVVRPALRAGDGLRVKSAA